MSKRLEAAERGLRGQLDGLLCRTDNLQGLENPDIADLLSQIKAASVQYFAASGALVENLRSLGNETVALEHENTIETTLRTRLVDSVTYLESLVGPPLTQPDVSLGVSPTHEVLVGTSNREVAASLGELSSRYVKGLTYHRALESLGQHRDTSQVTKSCSTPTSTHAITAKETYPRSPQVGGLSSPTQGLVVSEPEVQRKSELQCQTVSPTRESGHKDNGIDDSDPSLLPRRNAPSLTTLIKNRDASLTNLQSLMNTPRPPASERLVLLEMMETMKNFSLSFQDSCVSLLKWFQRHGAVQESEEVSSFCRSKTDEARRFIAELVGLADGSKEITDEGARDSASSADSRSFLPGEKQFTSLPITTDLLTPQSSSPAQIHARSDEFFQYSHSHKTLTPVTNTVSDAGNKVQFNLPHESSLAQGCTFDNYVNKTQQLPLWRGPVTSFVTLSEPRFSTSFSPTSIPESGSLHQRSSSHHEISNGVFGSGKPWDKMVVPSSLVSEYSASDGMNLKFTRPRSTEGSAYMARELESARNVGSTPRMLETQGYSAQSRLSEAPRLSGCLNYPHWSALNSRTLAVGNRDFHGDRQGANITHNVAPRQQTANRPEISNSPSETFREFFERGRTDCIPDRALGPRTGISEAGAQPDEYPRPAMRCETDQRSPWSNPRPDHWLEFPRKNNSFPSTCDTSTRNQMLQEHKSRSDLCSRCTILEEMGLRSGISCNRCGELGRPEFNGSLGPNTRKDNLTSLSFERPPFRETAFPPHETQYLPQFGQHRESVNFSSLGRPRERISNYAAGSRFPSYPAYGNGTSTGSTRRTEVQPGEGRHNERSESFAYPLPCDSSVRSFRPRPEFVGLEFMREQLHRDLLRGIGDPFDGTPERYHAWRAQLLHQLSKAQCTPLETLHVLLGNTTSKPKEMIQDFLTCCVDPEFTLDLVWRDLERRFGSNLRVSRRLLEKLENFPKIRLISQVSQMEALLSVCRAIICSMTSCRELEIFNFRSGLQKIWEKMPDPFITRWRHEAIKMERKTGRDPSLSFLFQLMLDYVDEVSDVTYHTGCSSSNSNHPKALSTQCSHPNKEDKLLTPNPGQLVSCVWHGFGGHGLGDCKKFRSLPYSEKINFLRAKKLCFKCTGDHLMKICKTSVKCEICNAEHLTFLCRNFISQDSNGSRVPVPHMNDEVSANLESVNTRTHCTQICGIPKATDRCCSKTMHVEIRASGHQGSIHCLAIVDEQSNASFCDPELPELLGVNATLADYSLTTLTQLRTQIHGSSVSGLEVRGVDEPTWIALPRLLTNPYLTDTSDEMATSEIVRAHRHLSHLAKYFPSRKPELKVRLLIGVNCGAVMRTKSYGETHPFVHRNVLGWSLVGPICIGSTASSDPVRCHRTSTVQTCDHYIAERVFELNNSAKFPPDQHDVFKEHEDDELIGLSQEDRKFLDIVGKGIQTNAKGNLEMPLPIKPNVKLPNNRAVILRRTGVTLNKIKADPGKADSCRNTMQKYLDGGHVEELQDDTPSPEGRTNYVPVFPVVHPKKKKVRLVFDSSSSYHGVSLNDSLLRGPDVVNNLVGVLLRFRHHIVAFAADVECMFHAFYVSPGDRDMLRFFWWHNNDPTNRLSTFRANVHIFGNRSSPAIATYGLRYAANDGDPSKSAESRKFISSNFYVDDGMGCAPDVHTAVRVLKGAIEILSRKKIRLHKIVSTHAEVLQSFPDSEIADDLSSIDISASPLQSALGLTWNIELDSFCLRYQESRREFTRRGILSVNGSLYDPLGIAAPVALGGRLLQRKYISSKENGKFRWDEPLPLEFFPEWENWVNQLREIPKLILPRCYSQPRFTKATSTELHVFSDASDVAIGYAMYLRIADEFDKVFVSFVFGNSKVAPRAATTIPRLELCAAVEATRAARHIVSELDISLTSITFYSDSRIVLGYLFNETRSFSRYVTSRRDAILRLSLKSQWKYISTTRNPADIATRPKSVSELRASDWLEGPTFLWNSAFKAESEIVFTDLPESVELKKVLKIHSSSNDLLSHITTHFSSWSRAIRVVACVLQFVASCRRIAAVTEFTTCSENFLIRECQKMSFSEYDLMVSGKALPKDSRILPLAPFLDDCRILRVGGRISRGSFSFTEKHPRLLPQDHPITRLVIGHYHEKTAHQGRVITGAQIRQNGFHILNQGRIISKFISSCVICRRLRQMPVPQLMADLPEERLEKTPAFLRTGVDVFGPYLIHDGKTTRRNSGSKKIWALLFTCLYSRAVHAETLMSLDITSLKLALRRFTAIRGACELFRSDCGTNFIGANNLQEDEGEMRDLLSESSRDVVEWKFNPPRASHFAGVWERKIGSIKRVLNVSIHLCKRNLLTREEFATFLLEAVAIVNSTPLGLVSSDPNDPFPVCPADLLNLRETAGTCQPSTPPNEKDLLSYGKLRYKRVEFLAETFWRGWKRDYIHYVQKRRKWKVPTRDAALGDVVVVRDESPRCVWPLGLIVDVRKSRDGRVRSATIQLKPSDSGLKRSVTRAVSDLVILVPRDQ